MVLLPRDFSGLNCGNIAAFSYGLSAHYGYQSKVIYRGKNHMPLISELTGYPEDPLPAELFHYTNQDGLLGIFKSKQFWTTKITCLNDSSEYFLAFKIAAKLLGELEKTNAYDKTKVHYLQEELWNSKNNVYVGSFSESGDLLSQWRAYGTSTSGYAIGLNSEKLREVAREQGFDLSKCIYDSHIQEELIRELIVKQLECGSFPEPIPYKYSLKKGKYVIPATTIFWHKLSLLAPLIKDKGFQEEQEWRLISDTTVSLETIEFRKGASFVIPYVSLNLLPFNELISSIIIGPTPHPDISLETLRMLLLRENFGHLNLLPSKVPFRFW